MIAELFLAGLSVAAQGNLAQARTAYSRCLGTFARAQIHERAGEAAFIERLSTACKDEETAFRAASIAADLSARIPRAVAERNANDEVGYIHENAVETFKSSLSTPQQ